MYVSVVVNGMYTYKTGHFGNKYLCFLVLLYKVGTHVILVILAMRICVSVSVILEGMYIHNTRHFGDDTLCVC